MNQRNEFRVVDSLEQKDVELLFTEFPRIRLVNINSPGAIYVACDIRLVDKVNGSLILLLRRSTSGAVQGESFDIENKVMEIHVPESAVIVEFVEPVKVK